MLERFLRPFVVFFLLFAHPSYFEWTTLLRLFPHGVLSLVQKPNPNSFQLHTLDAQTKGSFENPEYVFSEVVYDSCCL